MRFLSTFWLIALLVGCSIAQSKERTGMVKGRVVDEAGGIIPDSTITFANSNGKEFTAVSGQNGSYQLQLPAGIYAVRVEYSKHQAWDKFLANNFVMVPGEMRSFDVVLKVSREWTQRYGSPVTADPVWLNAKNGRAFLGGTVYDEQGGVVVDAAVTAVNISGEKFETRTGSDGKYELNLPFNKYAAGTGRNFKEATYDIVVESRGFKRSVTKDFVFAPVFSGRMNLDIALEIGPIVDIIMVPAGEKNKSKN